MAGQETYDFGECTWYVASTLPWVQGHWGNAADWAASAARAGFGITNYPVAGAVVVYAAGGGYSSFGHVAIVQSVYADGTFLVSEMNFVAFDQVDTRVSNMWDVAAFILPPGSNLGGGAVAVEGGGGGYADGSRTEWWYLQKYLNTDVDTHFAWLATLTNRLNGI